MWLGIATKRMVPVKSGLRKSQCLMKRTSIPWKTPICALPLGWHASLLLSGGIDSLLPAFSESDRTEPKLTPPRRPTFNKIISSTVTKAISKASRLGGVTLDTIVLFAQK